MLIAFFKLLYHPLAWAYDIVAWSVSLGRWRSWIQTVLPLLPHEGRVLELGMGPGYLQTTLAQQGMIFGIDESPQMIKMAGLRLLRARRVARLTRAISQFLPFNSLSFDAVVTTFPAGFIFQIETASEIYRVLKPGGKFIALLACRPSEMKLGDILIRALFQLTGQLPPRQFDPQTLAYPYTQAGLQAHCAWVKEPIGDRLIIEAEK